MKEELSFYDFTQLPEEQQYHITFRLATFLEHRISGKYKYVLYRLNNFFVEILYNSATNEVIQLTSYIDVKPNN